MPVLRCPLKILQLAFVALDALLYALIRVGVECQAGPPLTVLRRDGIFG
jgi:hypothetical protein